MLNLAQRKNVERALLALAAGRDRAAAAAESGLTLDQATLVDLVRGFARTADPVADANAIYALAAAVPGFNTPEANAKPAITDLIVAWPTLGVPPAPRTDAELDSALRGLGDPGRAALKAGLLELADLGRPPTAAALAARSGQPEDVAGRFLVKYRNEYDQHLAALRWWDDIPRNDAKKGPEQQAEIMAVLLADQASALSDAELAKKLRKIVPGVSDDWVDSLRHLRDHGRLNVPLQVSVSRRDRTRWLSIAAVVAVAASLLLTFVFGVWRDQGLKMALEQTRAGLTVAQAEAGQANKAKDAAEKAESDAKKAKATSDAELAKLGAKVSGLESKVAEAEAGRKTAEEDRNRVLADAAKGQIDANPALQRLLQAKDDELAKIKAELATAQSAGVTFTSEQVGKVLWEKFESGQRARFSAALGKLMSGGSQDPALVKECNSVIQTEFTRLGCTTNWWQLVASLTKTAGSSGKPPEIVARDNAILEIQKLAQSAPLASRK